MKILNFKEGEKIKLGIKTKEGIIDVEQASIDNSICMPKTIEDLIKGGKKALEQLINLSQKETKMISEDNIVYAPCVINPEKIVCVGLNYLSHGKECNMDIPEFPTIFSKFNNTLAAHKQEIPIPEEVKKVDYEAELVIIISKEAINVSKEDALSYVFGYTIGNDLSARDLQMRTSQWLLGKTCNNFAPIGPYVVTADEIHPNNLDISCKVNGETRQAANTKDMIFDCATIISYLSQHMILKPGDIIFTGTPSGVILGYPEDEQKWLKAGDEMIISIENIGSLVNKLI